MKRKLLYELRKKKTWLWIYNHLKENNCDYLWNMWKKYCEFCKSEGLHIPTYHSFIQYVRQLRKKGLIKLVKVEKSPQVGARERKYYAIANDNLEDWKNLWK